MWLAYQLDGMSLKPILHLELNPQHGVVRVTFCSIATRLESECMDHPDRNERLYRIYSSLSPALGI